MKNVEVENVEKRNALKAVMRKLQIWNDRYNDGKYVDMAICDNSPCVMANTTPSLGKDEYIDLRLTKEQLMKRDAE